MSSLILFFALSSLYQINAEEVICMAGQPCSCAETAPTPGETCIINCGLEDRCKAQPLTCRAGTPCYVRCDAKNACSETTTINAFHATDVIVVCAGDSACKDHIEIICGTGDCEVHCADETSCEAFGTIHTDNAKGFKCSGLFCPEVGTLDGQIPAAFSASPTPSPSVDPTPKPSAKPTTFPTKNPVEEPSANPTAKPTNMPTVSPTNVPSVTPTTSPLTVPTPKPSSVPTQSPVPTPQPSAFPTSRTSVNPTKTPTNTPSKDPSERPTNRPTIRPSANPISPNPSMVPSQAPISDPTKAPIRVPSKEPSNKPTNNPTFTNTPTDSPSARPTEKPTQKPTLFPTNGPTNKPTDTPTAKPTAKPTSKPTESPTLKPTAKPISTTTTVMPSVAPSIAQMMTETENRERELAVTREEKGQSTAAIVAAVTGICFMIVAFGWFLKYKYGTESEEGKARKSSKDDVQGVTLMDGNTDENQIGLEMETIVGVEVSDAEFKTQGSHMNEAVMTYTSDQDDIQNTALINVDA